MDLTHIDLAAVMRRLNLATVARLLADYEARAARESWSHREFLALLLAEEVAHRTDTRIKKLARHAHFPYLKTIEEFDFVFQSSLRRQQLGPYLGPEFVTATYVQPHVLVVDEVGYLQCADDAANVLYGVVDQRCLKRRPLVFTTNKPLKRWGEVLHDPELAEALLDRVLERGQHVRLGGQSWRTRETDPAAFSDEA